MNNNKYTPFIVFAIFLTGLLAGRYLFRSEGSDFSFSFFNGRVSKIQSVVNLVDKKYVDEVNIDYISEKIIPQILSLLDPHSTYVPANKRTESEQHLVGHFCGVGIEYAVFHGSPVQIAHVPSSVSMVTDDFGWHGAINNQDGIEQTIVEYY